MARHPPPHSFDQWGVELGKKLALGIKDKLVEGRAGRTIKADNPSTKRLLDYYVNSVNEDEEEETGRKQPGWGKNGPAGSDFARQPPQPHNLKDRGTKLN